MSTVTSDAVLALQIIEIRRLNPLVCLLRLGNRSESTESLPGFTAGAHISIKVRLPDGTQDWRRYSLINLSREKESSVRPTEYLVGVRLETEGRGGSRYLHWQVTEGDWLEVQAPRNDFPLQVCAGRTILIGGGIGITPVASMAAACRATARPVTLYYAGRSRSSMALLEELQQLLEDDLIVHVDDEQSAPLDIAAILDSCSSKDHLYICGPQPLLDAVLVQTAGHSWDAGRVHFELFGASSLSADDRSFELVLQSSGKRLTVPPSKSVLTVLNEAGCDVMFDCERGECGVCAVEVLSGVIDHRDYVLTEREKHEGRVMHACVSRCKGAVLVLNL